MKNLFYRNAKGNYIPITLDTVLQKDFENRLIMVKVGDADTKVTQDDLENFYELFMGLEVVKEVMDKSDNSSILVVPNSVEMRLYSNHDIKTKKVLVQIDADNISTAAVTEKLEQVLEKEVTVIPSSISLEEYLEVKKILRRSKIRKQRRGTLATS